MAIIIKKIDQLHFVIDTIEDIEVFAGIMDKVSKKKVGFNKSSPKELELANAILAVIDGQQNEIEITHD